MIIIIDRINIFPANLWHNNVTLNNVLQRNFDGARYSQVVYDDGARYMRKHLLHLHRLTTTTRTLVTTS